MSYTTHRIEISIDDQTLTLLENGIPVQVFAISTAEKGMGFVMNSYRTPTGYFRIASKMGAGEPSGTIFRQRVPVGMWHAGDALEQDLVLTRILTLDGLDEENQNTLERYIYIHGTNQEERIGSPASKGCIRMTNDDVVTLFDAVEVGCEVKILAATRPRGKLVFIDCDSTLSSIEGIDELARAKGDEVFARVVELTHAAMNGDFPLAEVFPRRMEMICPDRAICEHVAELYRATVVPGAVEFIRDLKAAGWLPVILSGGFAPLIEPLARDLGITHVEAVPLYFNEDGSYHGYGTDYPSTRNFGKNEIIREWKAALLPERVLMIGDGISDLETRSDVDTFIGYGGVITRARVQAECDYWLLSMEERALLDPIFDL